MSCWLLLGLLACAASPRWLEGCPLDAQETRAGLPCSPVWGLRGQKLQPTLLLLQPLALQCYVAMGASGERWPGLVAPTVQGQMGSDLQGPCPTDGPCLPHLGDSASPSGGDALLPPCLVPPAVSVHPRVLPF